MEHHPHRYETSFVTRVAIPFFIFCSTVVAFFPVLENGFVNWDDNLNFLENRQYRGLGWTQLRWMMTTFHGSNYRPLTWMTLAFDHSFWGMEAFGYHLTSLLLHSVNAVLFYFFVRHLLSCMRVQQVASDLEFSLVALSSALFFALHPLRVEVVAWASARNDVVAGLFTLWTLIAYLKYATALNEANLQRRRRLFILTLCLYALSLLSKGTGMTLPLVLTLLDVYPLKRFNGATGRQVFLEKLPFVALGCGAAILATFGKQSPDGSSPWSNFDLTSRLAQASYSVLFYPVKTFWPFSLSPLYPLADKLDPFQPVFLVAAIFTVATTCGLYLARHRFPGLCVGWCCYLTLLAPISGLVKIGPQITADRYSYLTCLPWAILAGAAQYRFLSASMRSWWARTASPIFFSTLILCILALASWRQSQVWRNSTTLWNHTLSIYPSSVFAHNNLGSSLYAQDKLEEAKIHFLKALEYQPLYVEAHVNLGMVLGQQGHLLDSIREFQTALKIEPRYWQTHYVLGVNFVNMANWSEASGEFREAIRLNPNAADARYELARILVRQGQLEQAILQLEQAVFSKPELVVAHRTLTKLLEIRKSVRPN